MNWSNKKFTAALIVITLIGFTAFNLYRIKQVCQASLTGIYFEQGIQYKCPTVWNKNK